MNRKYSLLILGLVIGACFTPVLLSGNNVSAITEYQDAFSYDIYELDEEQKGTEGNGYYDHYESGIYEDKYGKIFHK